MKFPNLYLVLMSYIIVKIHMNVNVLFGYFHCRAKTRGNEKWIRKLFASVQYVRLKMKFTLTPVLLNLALLTPKIWLLILPSSYYTFPCRLIMRIRCSINVINCIWWVWVFSLPVCCVMYEYYREKLHGHHFRDLEG